MALYGYRYGEIKLPHPGNFKSNVEISPHDTVQPPRRPDATLLPLCLYGAVPPKPDTKHNITSLTGYSKRAAKLCPIPLQIELYAIRQFIPHILKLRGFKPVTRLFTFDEWIETTNYTESKKQSLRKVRKELENYTDIEVLKDKKHWVVKCFIKDEHYLEYKYARGIYSRTDMFKCIAGPAFKSIEQEVFRHKWFIKKVPVSERPQYLTDTFNGYHGVAYATDYSSFEGSFTSEIMKAIEFTAYDWLLQNCTKDEKALFHSIKKIISGKNHLKFKHFNSTIHATRMSGEMNTSLGNGLTNYLVMEYLCHKNNNEFVGVVEGDDGLFKFKNNNLPTKQQYADLGFDIKIETRENHETASFCGIIYDAATNVNMTNPFYLLSKVGWGDKKYNKSSHKLRMQLLKAKCLSLAHQYPGCPIIGPFAVAVLKRLKDVTVRQSVLDSLPTWRRQEYIDYVNAPDFPVKEVALSTRLLMEKEMNIPVSLQIKLEEQLEQSIRCFDKKSYSWIVNPLLLQSLPQEWIHMFSNYVSDSPPVFHESKKYQNHFLSICKSVPKWWPT